jgi:lysophospholipid hydrolase
MHTRRLIAGETFLLEEEKGFCLVVEGTVQIFVRSKRRDENSDSESDEDESQTQEGRQRYQMLTEVKNGSPLSSLFSILSLFTEDVATKERSQSTGVDDMGSLKLTSMRSLRTPDHTSSRFRPAPRRYVTDPSKARSQPSSRRTSPEIAAGHLVHIPHLSLDSQINTAMSSPKSPKKSFETKAAQAIVSPHPHIVARAAEDSTIAIIPASAFKRLTKMYPRSTAHVVQVILTRFHRVTLATAHRYLGLTQQVLQIEKQMNKVVSSEIPGFLLDHNLERLKAKFSHEKERLGDEDISKGIALHNPRLSRQRRASSSIKKELAASTRITAARGKVNGITSRSSSPEDERSGISAGDLFKGKSTGSHPLQTPWPKITSPMEEAYFPPRPMKLQRQESLDEGTVFRDALLQCMCLAMGLFNVNALPKLESTEQSPRLVSYDSKKNKAVFNNVFGLVDPFELNGDGESESNYSVANSTVNANQSPNNVLDDIVDDVEIVYFQKGSVLVDQQERLPGLYYVVDGFLEVGITVDSEMDDSQLSKSLLNMDASQSSHDFDTEPQAAKSRQNRVRQSLFLVKPGSLAGYIPAISGFRSFVDVKAKSDVIVGFLPRASLERLVEKYPIILLTLAKRLTSLLDRLILHIDFALEYLQVDAGQVIYEQNQSSDAIYIILNGRLRAIEHKSDKSIDVLGEYGQGDSVGELEVLTETPRPGSLHAIRDSELARLPMTLFNSLALEHPAITLKMSKVLAKRMRTLMYNPTIDSAKEKAAIGGVKNTSSTVNLRTVGILPVRDGVPVTEFATRLANALTQNGTSVTTLNQAQVFKHLGRHAFSKMGKLKLSQYLADLEERFGIVLYVADTSVQSPWTSTCILQSDCILVVGVAEDSPSIGAYERVLLTAKTTARKELVLLHPERWCPAGLTRKWLNKRVWITGGHHHVQIVGLPSPSQQGQIHTRKLGDALKKRVRIIQSEIQKYTGRKTQQTPLYSSVAPFKSDFHRLARRLCGKSIGLVLGGGGARGCAHVGIIRAMEEAGIPIDIVGGTSIGAFVGALYAWDASIVPMYGRIKRFSGRMASIWRFALDLTYPAYALFS